ncbi:MAG TPA: AAC(3) family N-acetyltransferase [Thermotogota bacterium]|nr:AAC(3) family N-acetyltransferase [Thermotogota bacterium]
MYNKNELIRQIKALGIKPDDKILIHSSMKAIGVVEGGGDTVIDAFMDYLTGGLLVFPTHTWKQMNDDYNFFDPETEPSCVGILTNLFMKRENAFRSLHPTHSVAASGKGAEEFIKGEENSETPCSRTGCWGKLYDIDSKIIFLGCTLRSNTIIHGVEEWNDIPDRLTEEKHLYRIKLSDGSVIDRPIKRHYSLVGDVSEHYGKLLKPLLKQAIATTGTFGNAEVVVCKTREMVDLTSDLLSRKPDLFADDSEIPSTWY